MYVRRLLKCSSIATLEPWELCLRNCPQQKRWSYRLHLFYITLFKCYADQSHSGQAIVPLTIMVARRWYTFHWNWTLIRKLLALQSPTSMVNILWLMEMYGLVRCFSLTLKFWNKQLKWDLPFSSGPFHVRYNFVSGQVRLHEPQSNC